MRIVTPIGFPYPSKTSRKISSFLPISIQKAVIFRFLVSSASFSVKGVQVTLAELMDEMKEHNK